MRGRYRGYGGDVRQSRGNKTARARTLVQAEGMMRAVSVSMGDSVVSVSQRLVMREPTKVGEWGGRGWCAGGRRGRRRGRGR